MPSVAQQLQEAREARHLSIQQVADITKVRADHIRALEQGNFDVFSAPVYIRGFVRSYSTLLKLDVPNVMSALDAELGQTKKFAEPPPLSERSGGFLDFLMLQLSKLDWRVAAVLGGGLVLVGGLLLGVMAWRHYRTADPLKGLKPAVYQAPAKSSPETLPLPGKQKK
jgi:cytoskeletal protein RodZ